MRIRTTFWSLVVTTYNLPSLMRWSRLIVMYG